MNPAPEEDFASLAFYCYSHFLMLRAQCLSFDVPSFDTTRPIEDCSTTDLFCG